MHETVHIDSMKDNRKQTRYPCVGISLLYCALGDDYVSGLGSALNEAVLSDMSLSGLSFDVDRKLEPGSKLFILIQPDGEGDEDEKLITRVSWCKQTSTDHYRVGVCIESVETVNRKNPGVHIPIGTDNGFGIPSDVSMRCPACNEVSVFKFIGNQTVRNRKGLMPLYDCSSCLTTRSLVSILSYNRKNSEL